MKQQLVKGFVPNWAELREAMDGGEVRALEGLLAKAPALPRQAISWGQNCSIGPCQPLSYVAQARFNGFVRHHRTGEMASIIVAAGASINGGTADRETPLITAASYDEAEVARVLIEAGADLEATGYAVPEGTALSHAIEFGAPEIVDLLVAAGARIRSLPEAAGTGNLRGMLQSEVTENDKTLAFRAAALCDRLNVIDDLLAAGVSVGAMVNGGTALHWAAWEAKSSAARHLVARGAKVNLLDPEHRLTPLGWARYRAGEAPYAHPSGHQDVISFLEQCEADMATPANQA